ncbi:MAG: hypothetical protein CVU87_10690 [Firmicutes bacterium HGW-Firmicutes-12]|nr:MAG: hypothetical protein CVU87_10690 [Firmicutes bacterium HGW-Firmicutes-12]
MPAILTILQSDLTHQYDQLGNLRKKVNSAGVVDLYTYDNQGRKLSHTQQKTKGTQHQILTSYMTP